MPLKLATVLLALATIGAVVFGWRERARAARLTEELEQAKLALAAARAGNRSTLVSLGRALSSAMSAKRTPARPSAPATTPPPTVEAEEEETSLDQLPPEKQAEFFDVTDKLKAELEKKQSNIRSKLRLSADQEKLLSDHIAKMNDGVARSLDNLAVLASQKESARPRAIIDALVNGLNAIRDADEGFRAALDEGQRKQLQQDGFDLTTQIDLSMLLTKAIVFSAAMPQTSQ